MKKYKYSINTKAKAKKIEEIQINEVVYTMDLSEDKLFEVVEKILLLEGEMESIENSKVEDMKKLPLLKSKILELVKFILNESKEEDLKQLENLSVFPLLEVMKVLTDVVQAESA